MVSVLDSAAPSRVSLLFMFVDATSSPADQASPDVSWRDGWLHGLGTDRRMDGETIWRDRWGVDR